MMDNWAPSLRAAAATLGSNGGLNNNNNNNNSATGTANSPLFAAAQQRQMAFEQAARLALPKPAIPASLGNYGGLLGAEYPPNNNHGANISTSSATNLQMLRDALLFQDAVNGKSDASGFGLLQLQQRQRELISAAAAATMSSSSPSKLEMLPGPSLLTQILRGKKPLPPSSTTKTEGPLKKKLKTGAAEGNLESSTGTTTPGARVYVETPAEIKSTFPLPSTTEQQSKRKKKTKKKKTIVLKELQAKWDRLECESDAVEHDTDAAQEALVKECFLRALHRYNAEHLRRRCTQPKKSKRPAAAAGGSGSPV